MSLEDILSVDSGRRPRQRVGRGAASKGKTAGRGQKGEGARSGNRAKKWFEGGQKPCTCVYRSVAFSNFPHTALNIKRSACNAPSKRVDGDTINLAALIAAGLAHEGERIKLVGVKDWALSAAITIDGVAITGAAAKAVEAAGGGYCPGGAGKRLKAKLHG